jgi:Sap, sulfolipid-1-addressing protein
MWGIVLFFAFTAAHDPVRIGIVALLISRPRPMPHLVAYWLGLKAMGFGAALAALFLLGDFILSVTRVVTSAARNPVVPPIQIALGVVALSTAAMLAAPSSVRQAAYALVPGGDPSAQVLQPKTPTVFSRLSWRRLLADGSPRMAFVVGLGTATPLIEFWGAMMVIVASRAGAGAQVIAALMWILVAYAIAEIPLVSYLASPAKTQAVVMRLHDWLRAHGRPIFVLVLGVVGVFMVASGVGRV